MTLVQEDQGFRGQILVPTTEEPQVHKEQETVTKMSLGLTRRQVLPINAGEQRDSRSMLQLDYTWAGHDRT